MDHIAQFRVLNPYVTVSDILGLVESKSEI